MQQLIDRLLANDLADFEGLDIKGTIPISEALANELGSSYMNEFFSDAPSLDDPDTEKPVLMKVLKKLKPDFFKISFEAGKAVVNFELKR